MRRHWFFLAPLALMGVTLFAFLGGEVVKLLWNWLMPEIFGVRQITFWQAFGLLALSRILVGGFGLRGRRADRSWMKSGERERLRQRVRERCGFDPGAGEGQRPPAT